jgi:hypothetical protein
MSIRNQFGFAAPTYVSASRWLPHFPPNPRQDPQGERADAEFRQSGFVQIVPKRSQDCKKLAAALSRKVGLASLCVRRGHACRAVRQCRGTRLFEPAGISHSAPAGIGAADVWGLPGAEEERHYLRHRGRMEHCTRTYRLVFRSSATLMI